MELRYFHGAYSMSVFRIIDGNLHISTTSGLAEVPPELEQKLERTANAFLNKLRMPLPENPDLPFFAYGLFKPGQLGFDVLRDFVEESKPEHVLGDLMEKDGVPLFVDGCSTVGGVLLNFAPDKAVDAYQQIASIEPETLYKWESRNTVAGIAINLLVARSSNGARPIEDAVWDGRKDPLFHEALDLVELTLAKYAPSSQTREYSKRDLIYRLLELQMAYMLLWTSIERYTALRYHLQAQTMEKINKMTAEQGFCEALQRHVNREDKVYPTHSKTAKKLCATKPAQALDYYYQVRCNISHRGKAMMSDTMLVEQCTRELLSIFRDTLNQAFDECQLLQDRSAPQEMMQ